MDSPSPRQESSNPLLRLAKHSAYYKQEIITSFIRPHPPDIGLALTLVIRPRMENFSSDSVSSMSALFFAGRDTFVDEYRRAANWQYAAEQTRIITPTPYHRVTQSLPSWISRSHLLMNPNGLSSRALLAMLSGPLPRLGLALICYGSLNRFKFKAVNLSAL